MELQKQSWEVLAEEDKAIADSAFYLVAKGITEWDILMWLAEHRRKLAKDNFDSAEGEADRLTATILEQTAKELEKASLEAHEAGVNGDPRCGAKPELSDEEGERELAEKLLPLLDDGVEEIDILRLLAVRRKEVAMDERRGEVRTVDEQFARILHAGSEKIDAALEEWAEADPFEPFELDKVLPIRREERKIGRNEPCHCGSGKKFKKCHGRD
jgi:hypothetical protein